MAFTYPTKVNDLKKTDAIRSCHPDDFFGVLFFPKFMALPFHPKIIKFWGITKIDDFLMAPNFGDFGENSKSSKSDSTCGIQVYIHNYVCAPSLVAITTKIFEI